MRGGFQRSHQDEHCGRSFIPSATDYLGQCFDLFFARIGFVAFLRLRELGRLDDLFAGIGTPYEVRK